MRKLDETDRAIIAHLQVDGRKAFTDIAAELGISEGTVRRRVKLMTADGTLQIVGIVEPRYLDWQAAGMIGVAVHPGKIDDVAQQIASLPEVSYLFMASGGYDLFVEVFCRDRAHFASFLNDELHRIHGVERTETFMILKMYKLSYRWGESELAQTTPGPGQRTGVPSQ